MVAVLERVQGGIIGATLSSFGITGLYITFVFGAARVLRSATQNNRMRIPYEDLPTTRRLTSLCQARCAVHAALTSQAFAPAPGPVPPSSLHHSRTDPQPDAQACFGLLYKALRRGDSNLADM